MLYALVIGAGMLNSAEVYGCRLLILCNLEHSFNQDQNQDIMPALMEHIV